MDKCCEACGAVGFIDLLVTCSKCKSSHEHLYCMYAFPEVHRESWCCERCEGSIKGSSLKSPGAAHCDTSLRNELHTDTRKTSISHGTILQERRSMLNSRLGFGKPSQNSELMSPPTAKQQVIQSSEGLRSSYLLPLATPSHVIPSSTLPLDDYCLCTPASDSSWKEPSSKAPGTALHGFTLHNEPMQTSISRERRFMLNSELVSGEPSHHSGQMSLPTAQQQVMQSSEGLTGGDISPNLELQLAPPSNGNYLYTPAPYASWNGTFKVLLDDTKGWEVSCCIEAHPPSRVRREVERSSKLIPQVVEFELVQRKTLWNSLFENCSPDRRDIGLYFFPSDPVSYTNYIYLLKRMGGQDLMLRKDMDDLELLVFTSEILPMDCKKWKDEYFLWGVFYRKNSSVASIPQEIRHDEGNKDEVAEMKIDTMGEISVGRSDVLPISTLPSFLPADAREETSFGIPPCIKTNVGISDIVRRVTLALPPPPDIQEETYSEILLVLKQ